MKSRNYLHRHRALYADHGFLHHEIARRMIQHLGEGEPNDIVNDGAFDEYFTNLLRKQYPKATVMENIDPDQHQEYDLIVSNLYLQDLHGFEERLRLYYERLKGGGRLLFTTIGMGSFYEWYDPDGFALNGFPDIEDIGNFMHGLGFKDSVLYIEKITLTYERIETLLNDARVVAGRPFEPYQGLRTPQWLERTKAALERNHDGTYYNLSFDIIYADASLPDIKNRYQDGEVRVDITNLLNS